MVEPNTHHPNGTCPGCLGPLPEPKATGRPAKYCSDRCKSRAYRDRLAAREYVPAVDVAALHLPEQPAPGKQMASAVAEADSLSAIFLRLSLDDPRPSLAWRCERMGLAIRAALDEFFGGIV